MTDTLTDRSIKSIGDSLREFGYPVEDTEVRETADRLMRGESAGADIIALFIARMLRDAGVLPEPAV